jgi:hypothetical protein
MKRVQYFRFGGPDELRLDEVKAPDPGKGQIRVQVRAAAAGLRMDHGRFAPVPGQQFVEPRQDERRRSAWPADVLERIAAHPAHRGDNEAVHGGGALTAVVRAAEQPRFPAQSDALFILPMSGRSWKSITDCTHILAVRSPYAEWSSERQVTFFRCRGQPA